VRIAIIQSCYVPWKGFFDLIGQCDQYVIFDSAQFVKRHWHNRNQIKTARGLQWLTIPVVTKGRYEQPIDEVEVAEQWADKHWRAIELAYRRASFFAPFADRIRGWYERAEKERRLTDINTLILSEIVALLGFGTKIVRDTAYPVAGRKTERLLEIAVAAGADEYLSGPSARTYLDEDLLRRAGVAVKWMRYEGYPEYPQLHGAFEHAVSVLDVIFNVGTDAPRYIVGTR
jgi:hypothetical protein